MLIQTDTQKKDFINYMNFRIKNAKEQFYKDNKITNFLASLIKWDFRIAEKICWFFMALIPFVFISPFFLHDVIPLWYLVPIVVFIFCISSIFSNINEIEEKPVVLLKCMPLTEQDLSELKYFFNEDYMDKVLKEFCEKKGGMSWAKFTLILNLLKEEFKENELKEKKETDIKNFEELKNRIFNRG